MTLSSKAQKISGEISKQTKLGDLRKIAKEIKKDHELAMELWSTADFRLRLLSILIMDSKKLEPKVVRQMFDDMQSHYLEQRNQLADWLMANQLTKNKSTITLMESWQDSTSTLQRRIFWYHQGRLRWVGQTPPGNTEELLAAIGKNMLIEEPEVQWAMNFTAGWIGIYDKTQRDRCIKMGEEMGLYKDDFVHKGCTPNYLPKFIEIEVGKRT